MITIGEQKLTTRRPANLDEQLIAATGCSAAEHAAILSRPGTSAQVARAAMPFLTDKDGPTAGDLAEMIDAADAADDIRGQVAALLAPDTPATKAEEPNG